MKLICVKNKKITEKSLIYNIHLGTTEVLVEFSCYRLVDFHAVTVNIINVGNRICIDSN